MTQQDQAVSNIKLCVDKFSDREIAMLKGEKWPNGTTLRVRFLDGVPDVQARVEKYFHQWEDYANIKFVFGNDKDAEIRVSFEQNGSWSYIGTDCLNTPKDEPTMNFGWLRSDTDEDEYSRVVLHEVGHALGYIHEHQNPTVGIKWNKPAVYEYFKRTNGWGKEEVDNNIFARYSQTLTNFTEFDPKSIMLYAIPKELTLDGFHTDSNTTLSEQDKEFTCQMYPKQGGATGFVAPTVGERAAETRPQ